MTSPTRKIGFLAWSGMALIVATLLLVVLPSFMRMRERAAPPIPMLGTVANFTLTNQDGRAISLADLKGKVWVADIIFTRCAGPCLKMTRQMRELQQALPADGKAELITLSTDPDYDRPAVLKTFAGRFGADHSNWQFLTGSTMDIFRLATESLKLTALPKPPETRENPQDLFIHSTLFVIVDKNAQLRGVFETSGERIDPREVQKEILSVVERLERE
jgi:protein SCO1/2